MRSGNRRALRLTLLGLFGLAVLLAIGILPRMQRHTELAEAVKATRSSALVVSVVKPTPGARVADLMLPGSIRPSRRRRSTRGWTAISSGGSWTSATG